LVMQLDHGCYMQRGKSDRSQTCWKMESPHLSSCYFHATFVSHWICAMGDVLLQH
jgi:hypothetical protein